jgi:hypothetical protein
MSDDNYYVVISEEIDGEYAEVRRMGPHSYHKAEKIERGVSINLNHDRFVTDIERVSE